MGYQLPIFKEYVNKYDAEVHVVHWDYKKLTPYYPPEIEGVWYYKRSNFSLKKLRAFVTKTNPDIVYVSGWMDKGYLQAILPLRKRGVPVVTAFDDIWLNTIRQRLASVLFPIIKSFFFSHAWVSGPYQFEFAKRLGFKNNEIIFDMLSADTSVFQEDSLKENTSTGTKSFLYVGTFRCVKGVDILIEAFNTYINKYNGKWKLFCVGNGELENDLLKNKNIKILPFSNSNEIIQIAKNSNVFILPSRHDQWGVVVHEFTSLGFPLLLAENIGAKPLFFINGFNGFRFKNNSADHLAELMYKFEKLNDSELNTMGLNSKILSKRINSITSAANFMSILNS